MKLKCLHPFIEETQSKQDKVRVLNILMEAFEFSTPGRLITRKHLRGMFSTSKKYPQKESPKFIAG